jgi:hypothetical protein
MIGRGNRSTRRKPAPVPLCPPILPHTFRSFVSPIKTLMQASPHECYTSCPSHPPWLDHSNYTSMRRRAQVMKLLTHYAVGVRRHAYCSWRPSRIVSFVWKRSDGVRFRQNWIRKVGAHIGGRREGTRESTEVHDIWTLFFSGLRRCFDRSVTYFWIAGKIMIGVLILKLF